MLEEITRIEEIEEVTAETTKEEKQYKMLTTLEKLESEIERMNDESATQITDTAKAYLKDYNRELLIAKYLEWAKMDEPVKTALVELYVPRWAIKRNSKTLSYSLEEHSKAIDILDFIDELQSRTDYKKLVEHIPSKNLLRERSENLCIAIALRMSAKTAKDDAHKAKKADEIINYYKRSKSNTTTAKKLESLSKSKFDTELESWFKDILPKFKDEDGNEHNVFLTRSDKAFIEDAFTSIDKNAEHSIAFVKPDTLRAIFVKVLHRIVTDSYYGDTFKRADTSYYPATVKNVTNEPAKTETAE